MKYPKIPLAQTVVQLCKAKHIQHIVLSPGSRNAPLTIGFTHDDYFKCYSIVDERCAAFFALGIAQQINAPVAVVCTSGSALLNYYPAVSEAFYSNIPLVVLSADRPKYLLDIGDGQTINQEDVYKNHILYSANLKLDLDENKSKKEDDLPIMKNIENRLESFLGLQQNIQEFNETEINKAINISLENLGPVHINIPFDEPLYDRVDVLSVNPKVILPNIKNEEETDYQNYAEIWNKADRKLVLVGVLDPNSVEQKYVNQLAEDDSVLIMTETTSNLHHPKIIPSIDKLIAALNTDEFDVLKPEIVLTFGGLIVSKKIKRFLRDYQPKHHWHVGKQKANDTFFVLDKVFKQTENSFFKRFLPLTIPNQSKYASFWLLQFEKRKKNHQDYIDNIAFTDFKVFDSILNTVPNNWQLQVSNSSTIRYLQLFDINPTLKVFCNRGTSGIDGSTSTAIGAAIGNANPTLFVTGDLSFFYDSNALWNNYIPNDFRIIVINNEGGGIFRILPGHKDTANFDYYFETKHHLTAEHLCKMYNFDYVRVNNEYLLNESLSEFYKPSDQPRLLEVFTPSTKNDQVLLDYFNAIK